MHMEEPDTWVVFQQTQPKGGEVGKKWDALRDLRTFCLGCHYIFL